MVGADGKVKIIYKDLPILGEASKIAALAALASVKQGKHHGAAQRADGIHRQARPRQDPRDRRLGRASTGPSSRRTWKIPKLKRTIDRNMALASALGMRGTPAFVIGKQFVPGAVDAAALKQLIADARKS